MHFSAKRNLPTPFTTVTFATIRDGNDQQKRRKNTTKDEHFAHVQKWRFGSDRFPFYIFMGDFVGEPAVHLP